jgi:hypothetical protein
MEKQIVTEILLKAKKNILELTDNYDKAESVTRMLNNNERFQMNKAFPMIKKRYGESFGLNNKKLDDVEITQFIQNQLESSQALITGPKKPKPEYRKFDKQELLIILDQLNSDDQARLSKFEDAIKGTVESDSEWKKEEIVKIFVEALPELNYADHGRYLDEKM